MKHNDDPVGDWRYLRDEAGFSALQVLMLFVAGKQQPPQELLEALQADYERYFDAGGRLSLEEALLHQKPKKGEGNAAQRAAKKAPKLQAVLAFSILKHRGVPARRAAELVTKKYHPIDPASFEREMRSIEKALRDSGWKPGDVDLGDPDLAAAAGLPEADS